MPPPAADLIRAAAGLTMRGRGRVWIASCRGMSSNGPQCGASRWKAISTKVARPGSLFSMRLRFQYVFGFFKTGGSFGEIIVASRAGAKVFLARPWTAPSRSVPRAVAPRIAWTNAEAEDWRHKPSYGLRYRQFARSITPPPPFLYGTGMSSRLALMFRPSIEKIHASFRPDRRR
jgi:hypothetical protein